MTGLWNLNLIHFFDFYLAVVFLLGTYRRFGQYRAIGNLVISARRWPRLLELVKEHSMIFLTWATVLPALLTLLLCVVQMLASRLLFPEAGQPPHGLTVARLTEQWIMLPFVLGFGLAMLGVDIYGIAIVGEVDRKQMEVYFDQAEYWLKAWHAPVVHFFTLGRINPRQMVAVEVRNALVQASQLINSTLWWLTAQVGLRIAFGLALWGAYALNRTG